MSVENVLRLIAPDNQCYDELFVKHDLSNGACVQMAVGNSFQNLADLAIVLVFVPQILRLLFVRSSECLSFPAVLLETVALTAPFVLDYQEGKAPASEYRDSMLLVIQCAMLMFLVLACRGNIVGALVTVVAYLFALTFLTSNSMPSLVAALKGSSLFLILASRMLQTLVCFKEKSAGQMSTVTWSILLYKATTALFTMVQIAPIDVEKMICHITESAFNGMILSQVAFSTMYYGYGQQKWKAA